MKEITFITGNQNKAKHLARNLAMPVRHQKIDLEEIQSLELAEVVEHKVRQAYELVKKPVIVEDVSLSFEALGGRLPGTFIRFYNDEVPPEITCRTLDGLSRDAVGRSMFGYYDGTQLKLIEGSMKGTIAQHPRGENGFGWDKIFIPIGYTQTRAELSDEEYATVYKIIKPVDKLKSFLESVA